MYSFFLSRDSTASEFYVPTLFRNTLPVSKRWHIKFRRRVVTQKKEYKIHNKAKVWNHEWILWWLCQSELYEADFLTYQVRFLW